MNEQPRPADPHVEIVQPTMEQYLTEHDIARMLQCSLKSVRRMIQDREIPRPALRYGRIKRWSPQQWEQWERRKRR